MRVTQNSMIRDFLAGISLTRQRLNKLQLQLATEKRFTRPSEDPEAASVLLRTDMELGKLEKFTEAISAGKSLLKMTANGLDQISSILQDVKGVLVGAQGPTEPSQLGRLADQLDGYLDLVLDIANTQYDGKYIFGGTKTTTPPFVRSGSAQQIVYTGNADPIEYQVGLGMIQRVSISGAAAFSSTGAASLTGSLDRNAAVGSIVTNTLAVTDGMGASHLVQLTYEKTASNTWKVSSSVPPGTSDAAVAGGTAIITFDPVTGAVSEHARGAPLTLTPNVIPPARDAAPTLSIVLSTAALTEQPGGSATNASYSQTNVIDKLREVRDGLRSGHMPSSDDIYLLNMMNESITREAARAGLYSTALERAGQYQTGLRERLLDLKSAKQDVDLAEIGIKLKVEQTALDAALSAAAQIMPKSLMDFLK